MKYKKGDYAIYSSHGVVEITGTKDSFYVTKSVINNMIFLLTESLLRPLHSRQDLTSMLNEVFTKHSFIDTRTWNRRYRDNMEKLVSGNITLIAEIVRDLEDKYKRNRQDLSFGERKMLNAANELIDMEYTHAK